MALTEKEYFRILGETPTSRLNDIIYMVNCNVPKAKANLKSDFERMFYDRLIAEADRHERKYGDRPVFDMGEIETDDPRLDIYSGPAERNMDEIDEV